LSISRNLIQEARMMASMTTRARLWRGMVSVVVIVSVLAPVLVGAAITPLGTARAVRAAQLSLDGGKNWLPVGARALPILHGTEIRSTSGQLVLEFADGSRVTVLPFSALRVTDTGRATELLLLYGRLAFQLPAQTRVAIITPPARLEPVRSQKMVGELFLTGTGLIGVKMTSGQLQVQQLTDPQQVMVASLEPVFLPKKPVGFLFSSDRPSAIPTNAKSIFTPNGESIGYLSADGGLMVNPGFTADLTRPFSPKLVRLAMAGIPAKDRMTDAMPLFDVNGQYVGYLAGPMFYATHETGHPAQPGQPVQPGQPAEQGEPTEGPKAPGLSKGAKTTLWVLAGVAVVGGVAGLALGGGGGGGGGGKGAPPSATPVAP